MNGEHARVETPFPNVLESAVPRVGEQRVCPTNPSLVVTVRTDRINTCVIEVIEDLEGFAGLGVDIAPLGGNVPRVGEDQRCDKTE